MTTNDSVEPAGNASPIEQRLYALSSEFANRLLSFRQEAPCNLFITFVVKTSYAPDSSIQMNLWKHGESFGIKVFRYEGNSCIESGEFSKISARTRLVIMGYTGLRKLLTDATNEAIEALRAGEKLNQNGSLLRDVVSP